MRRVAWRAGAGRPSTRNAGVISEVAFGTPSAAETGLIAPRHLWINAPAGPISKWTLPPTEAVRLRLAVGALPNVPTMLNSCLAALKVRVPSQPRSSSGYQAAFCKISRRCAPGIFRCRTCRFAFETSEACTVVYLNLCAMKKWPGISALPPFSTLSTLRRSWQGKIAHSAAAKSKSEAFFCNLAT